MKKIVLIAAFAAFAATPATGPEAQALRRNLASIW